MPINLIDSEVFYPSRWVLSEVNKEKNKFQGSNSHNKYTSAQAKAVRAYKRRKRNKKRKELKRR